MQRVYGVLAVVGFLLPVSQFAPWFLEHGLDVGRFLTDLFANKIGGFFGMDVFVAAIVTVIFILHDGKQLGLHRLWPPILGTLVVGVSFGLPLFLALREPATRPGSIHDVE